MQVRVSVGLDKTVDLSIIIVNWNSADYLRACLSSVYREIHGVLFEVIVVDNASGDGCEQMIRTEFPDAIFIQTGKNVGFARANNLGYLRSQGDCLLFLNPDTVVVADAIVGLLSHLRSERTVGAVGARLVNTDGSLQTSCVQAFPTLSNQLLDSDLLRRTFPNWQGWGTRAFLARTDCAADVEVISGACFMVKRAVFEQVGMFGEQYFMYSDDLDLSYKIHKKGYSIRYLNGCKIIHHGGKSSSKQSDHFSDVLQKDSLLRFFRSTKGPLYSGLYRAALAIMAALRMAITAFLVVAGCRTIQGKAPVFAFQKWATIFGWALGFDACRRIAERTQSTV